MKTNIVLESKDMELFGVTIKQETKTGFLSISELQKAYEVARWEFGWSQLDISSLMQSAKMVERIYYLLKDKDLIKTEISTFIELCKKEGITKVLKGLGVWKTTGARANKSVMCDPYIWVSIALELNPMIYAKVITFVTDSLVFDRIQAGTEYLPMNNAIKTVVQNPEYYKYAIAINKRVFGKHFTGMRDLASANELKSIAKIEQFVTQCIELGMITNENQIIKSIENFKL